MNPESTHLRVLHVQRVNEDFEDLNRAQVPGCVGLCSVVVEFPDHILFFGRPGPRL